MNIAVRDSTADIDYLARLNAEQQAAVQHGGGGVGGPLLIIAGAGSGKTNTLAHRVAHLLVKGADPRRILLMTFSRRAATEMTRRVARIAAEVMGDKAAVLTEGLFWAGTFHAMGARLLRDYALEIGLDASFTIHDREDSADLMNLVRHELGLSKTESLGLRSSRISRPQASPAPPARRYLYSARLRQPDSAQGRSAHARLGIGARSMTAS